MSYTASRNSQTWHMTQVNSQVCKRCHTRHLETVKHDTTQVNSQVCKRCHTWRLETVKHDPWLKSTVKYVRDVIHGVYKQSNMTQHYWLRQTDRQTDRQRPVELSAGDWCNEVACILHYEPPTHHHHHHYHHRHHHHRLTVSQWLK